MRATSRKVKPGVMQYLHRFDQVVIRQIGAARRGWLSRLIVPYTISGTIGLPWVIAGAVLGHAVLLAVVVAAAALSADLIKRIAMRQRPAHLPLLVRPLRSASFPSGHAASSAASALVLTMLAPDFAVLWIAMALAMALSRVYVGVHYPTDILAGIGLGLLAGVSVLVAVAA